MGGRLLATSRLSVRNILSAPRVVWFIISFALALFLAPHNLYAQSANTGTVEGVVTDPSSAAVVGASVTLVDASTGISRSATTNDSGRYFFANVVPGKYTVTINKSGFRVLKFTDQTVNVGTNLLLKGTLELGSATETVEVTATGVELQTLNATVGNTVSGDLLANLPSIGRDASTFVTCISVISSR